MPVARRWRAEAWRDNLAIMARSVVGSFLLAALASCASTAGTTGTTRESGATGVGGEAEDPGTAGVSGVVHFDGKVPQARTVEVQEEYCAGVASVADETWIVSPDGGVANCVVTLTALGETPSPPLKPLAGARLSHVGARYEPHVLVVPAGTTVALRNENSDCGCFHVRSRRNPSFNGKLAKGEEHELVLEREDTITVFNDILPWMRAVIAVVDTPLFALTDAGGAFRFDDVAPGRYRLEVWHEDGLPLRSEVDVEKGEQTKLGLVLAPRDNSRLARDG